MPNSKVQSQSREITILFCSHGTVATRCLVSLFVLTNEGSKLMWKDMLIIIHLPSNYTPGLSGIDHAFYFSAPTAGLPAGAAGLTDREVTTRGQPQVIFSHTLTQEEEKSFHPGRRESLADLLCHSFLFVVFIHYTYSILISVLKVSVFLLSWKNELLYD